MRMQGGRPRRFQAGGVNSFGALQPAAAVSPQTQQLAAMQQAGAAPGGVQPSPQQLAALQARRQMLQSQGAANPMAQQLQARGAMPTASPGAGPVSSFGAAAPGGMMPPGMGGMTPGGAGSVPAGAGGQAIGLEQAGIEHAGLVELNKSACATLRLNRPAWNVIEQDLTTFDGTSFKGVDIISGGLPCPPFSVAGKQLGVKDERNLFPVMIRLVDQIRPRAIMIENVRGFLDAIFQDYRSYIKDELVKLGYEPGWKLMNASDFGRAAPFTMRVRTQGRPATKPGLYAHSCRRRTGRGCGGVGGGGSSHPGNRTKPTRATRQARSGTRRGASRSGPTGRLCRCSTSPGRASSSCPTRGTRCRAGRCT